MKGVENEPLEQNKVVVDAAAQTPVGDPDKVAALIPASAPTSSAEKSRSFNGNQDAPGDFGGGGDLRSSGDSSGAAGSSPGDKGCTAGDSKGTTSAKGSDSGRAGGAVSEPAGASRPGGAATDARGTRSGSPDKAPARGNASTAATGAGGSEGDQSSTAHSAPKAPPGAGAPIPGKTAVTFEKPGPVSRVTAAPKPVRVSRGGLGPFLFLDL